MRPDVFVQKRLQALFGHWDVHGCDFRRIVATAVLASDFRRFRHAGFPLGRRFGRIGREIVDAIELQGLSPVWKTAWHKSLQRQEFVL